MAEMINKNRLSDKYGDIFVISVDYGAWCKITEGCAGRKFNRNSIHPDSKGDQQARLTEYYFITLLRDYGIPVCGKSVEWELWDNTVFGRKIDVKSKRRNTNPPNFPYDYHVDHSQLKHPCDHYVWADVFYTDKMAEFPEFLAFAGWLPKYEFMEKSRPEKAGEIDHGWTAKVDARKINNLRTMGSLMSKLMKIAYAD